MRAYKSAYKEHEVIGQGKFTHVVLVENLETHLFCIAKKILISSLSPKEQDSSLQELSLLRNLKHPNIVTYHESFLEEGYLIIIMEYCEEGDLYYHIQQQKKQNHFFPEKTVLNWFLQAVMAVEFIHKNQVLHRDLKTSNIFLTSCGSIKIGDFGIAKVLTATQQISNTLVGTPNYLSPELCESKPYTYKADMWALGCILYELLALKVPFQSNNLMELIQKISKEDVEPLPKQYSNDIKRLVRSLLSKEDKKRPSCQEILAKPIFIRVMQDFLTGGAKELIQKKVPIKQYSLHNQLKKKSPEKIIHKKITAVKKGENPTKSNLSSKPAEMFGQLKISKSPISPVKGVSLSQQSQGNKSAVGAKRTKNSIQSQSQGKISKPHTTSLSKRPSQQKNPLENNKNLKISGKSIKPAQNSEQIKTPTPSQDKANTQESEEDPTINSILMNTELSFNISLTQDSAFYTKDQGKMRIKEFMNEIPERAETKESSENLPTSSNNDNMKIEENEKVEDVIFAGIETRDDDSSLEEEYKDDFEEDTETDIEKMGRLTLPKTKEKLNEMMDLYKSQLAESQKLAQTTLYEGNLKVIEEDMFEMSSQEMSKKKQDLIECAIEDDK